MKLEKIFLEPMESRLYCEWSVNFPKYFYNPMEDDLTKYNPNDQQLTEVYLTKQDIESFSTHSFVKPKQFVMNRYEWLNHKKSSEFTPIPAYKTGSPRTFFIPDLEAYVKTHFRGRISSNYRNIDKKNVSDILGVNIELINLMKTERWPKNTAFLPEYGGVIWRDIGCIYRSINSYPEPSEIIIPLYSLCGIDINAKEELPLFVQIAQRRNIDPTTFLLEEIISPLITSWNFFVFEQRRKITCHGQNILIGFSSNLDNFKIIHRDLQAKSYNELLTEEEINEISKLYDFHIGWLLFDEIKNNNRKYIHPKEFTQRIKELYNLIVNVKLCDYRVYEQGIGANKETLLLEKRPKYR